MKKIYVDTPNGKRMHGYVYKEKFMRVIESKYVRWSDRAFTVNSTAIPQIEKLGVETLVFFYKKKDGVELRIIPLGTALWEFSIVSNEHGEKNLRVPMEATKLVKELTHDQFAKEFKSKMK